MKEIGIWTDSGSLMINDPNMWNRRANLYGAIVRVTMIHYPLLSTNFIFDSHENLIGGRGFLFDILHNLEIDLNFTSSLSLSIDGKYGGVISNGTGDGMVGMLMRDETDVAVASLTYTAQRHKAIDYTIPIFPRVYSSLITSRVTGTTTNLTVYMERFSLMAWAMIALTALILATAFYIVSESGVNSFHFSSDPEKFGLLQSIGMTMMILMQLTYNGSIKSASAKVLFFSSSIFAYLIFTFFACDLISGMTAGTKDVPIKNFQDVLDQGYQVITLSSTSNHEFLLSSRKGTAMHNVYWNTIHGNQDNFFVNLSNALERVSTQKQTLLWGTDMNIMGKHDMFSVLKLEDGITTQSGWGIQKASEYSELLNYWLHKLDESGLKDRILQGWANERIEESTIADAENLGYDTIAYPFLFLTGGVTIAIASFVFEQIHWAISHQDTTYFDMVIPSMMEL